MGADNYRICPKCAAAKQAKLLDAIKRHDALYGKVSRKEYKAGEKQIEVLRAAANKQEETLAEYYEIRVCEDGEFVVYYGARCNEGGCDFEFNYEHKEQVPLQ